jgi:hypothetical protein
MGPVCLGCGALGGGQDLFPLGMIRRVHEVRRQLRVDLGAEFGGPGQLFSSSRQFVKQLRHLFGQPGARSSGLGLFLASAALVCHSLAIPTTRRLERANAVVATGINDLGADRRACPMPARGCPAARARSGRGAPRSARLGL